MKKCIAPLLLALVLSACKKPPPTQDQPRPAAPTKPAVAEAPIAKPRQLTPDERKRYGAAMKAGRKAEKKGDHAAAATGFQGALAIQPDDPAALSELGWVAFLQKDLDQAERTTKRAVAAASDQRVKAASLYNLGQIAEARGQRDAAVVAYRQSLELRPSRTVREQLAKLDPAAAAAADPLRPKPMAGPFASLEAFCDSLGDDNRDRERCPAKEGMHGEVDEPAAPFKEARYIESADAMTCYLVVRLASGWFGSTEGFLCHEPGHLDQTQLEFDTADRVPGGGAEVVLHLLSENQARQDVELTDDEGNVTQGRALGTVDCDRELYVCGVGPSGKPSCLHLMDGKAAECSGPEDKIPWTWRLEPAFADGQLDLKAFGKPGSDEKALAGRRPFAFP